MGRAVRDKCCRACRGRPPPQFPSHTLYVRTSGTSGTRIKLCSLHHCFISWSTVVSQNDNCLRSANSRAQTSEASWDEQSAANQTVWQSSLWSCFYTNKSRYSRKIPLLALHPGRSGKWEGDILTRSPPLFSVSLQGDDVQRTTKGTGAPPETLKVTQISCTGLCVYDVGI